MATNENGHLAASPIDVEPTALQEAAHAMVEALNSQNVIDWAAVEANFNLPTAYRPGTGSLGSSKTGCHGVVSRC